MEGTETRAHGATVLVVDDDDALRKTMVRALESHGYEVLAADSGFQARKVHEKAGRVDLIIMDLVLPGMEGRESANLLMAHQPDVKILYTSGYSSLESLRSGLTHEGEAFLRKPFEVDELIEAVEETLADA